MIDSLLGRLMKTFKGDIAYDGISLEKYSRDASLFKIKPEVIVFPKTSTDVQALVKAVNEERAAGNKINITARAAGTDMTGGPLTTSVVVEFMKYFNQVKEVKETSEGGYAITQPGVFYRDFEKETLKKNLLMPAYPASRLLCAIGGIVANNSGGEKTLMYGNAIDYVTSLKMVLRDGTECEFKVLTMAELEEKKKLQTLEGELYRDMHALIEKNYDKIMAAKPNVSKNASGYYLWKVWDKQKGTFDLSRIIVGSQGTLGIITEVKLRLVRPKTHSQLLIVFMKDLKHLGDLTNHLLQFKPESLESYDDHTFKIAMGLLPSLIRKMKGNFFSLLLKFIPEFWASLTGKVPKLIVLAEFTSDTDEEAKKQALKAQESLKEFGVTSKLTTSADEAKKFWTIRREGFNILRSRSTNLKTAVFIEDLVVNPEHLPEYLPKLYTILDHYNIPYAIQGHVGNGNFHIFPLIDMHKAGAQEMITEIMNKVSTLALEYKGSITGEHNDGVLRTPFVEQMFGTEVYKLFEETKKIFDRENIFNPGKKVGGDWKYAMEHMDV
ncbi:MAG: FAD-binding oxidoreductase [bacterium]|nr:FAD-binding oxidoreductase [bacterium]